MTSRRALFAALLLVVAGWVLLALARRPWASVTGDEPTYLAMAESLARDGDLAFGSSDRERIEKASDPQRRAVILQRTGRGVFYSKPALYPLLAAPFVRLAGGAGLWGVNLLAFLAAGAVAWTTWRRLGGAEGAGWTLLAFGGAGVAPAYLVWGMSDILQLSLAVAGACLAVASIRRQAAPGGAGRWIERPWTAPAAGACLGLLAAVRLPNALVGLAVFAALWVAGRRRRAAVVAAAAGIALAGAMLADLALSGHPAPYRAERATFNVATGYPAGDGAEAAMSQFDAGRATHQIGPRPGSSWRVSAYSALYFLVGRHTGAIVYLPLFLVLLAAGLASGDPAGRVLAMGAVALGAFYLLWMPGNYFGGEAFVGNRYLLPAYGLLAAAPARLPGRRALVVVALVAAAVGGSAIASSMRYGEPGATQSHAYAGLFRWLPYESTAQSIAGRRDRYWSDELVRFVDPFATAEEHGLRLASVGPPAELLVANDRPLGTLRFIVQGEGPELEVSWRDWRGERRERFGPGHDGRARGVLEIQSTPWRRHPFWWRPDDRGFGRAVRLAIADPGGAPTTAEMRYLGPYRLARKFFDRFVVAAALPERAVAGTSTSIDLTLRNTGRRPWESRAVVPVHLGYRLTPAAGGRARSGPLSALPGVTARGQQVEGSLAVAWPRREGRWRLEVDLLVGGTVWFADIVGQPVAAAEVEVVAAEEGDR